MQGLKDVGWMDAEGCTGVRTGSELEGGMWSGEVAGGFWEGWVYMGLL
jgi:hypothetical protein